MELEGVHGCALCCSGWLEGMERLKNPRLLSQETKVTERGGGNSLQLCTRLLQSGEHYLFLCPQCTGPVVMGGAAARED